MRNTNAEFDFKELGHTVRGCNQEQAEIIRVTVKCVNCDESQILPVFVCLNEALTKIQSVIEFVTVRRSASLNSAAETVVVCIFPYDPRQLYIDHAQRMVTNRANAQTPALPKV